MRSFSIARLGCGFIVRNSMAELFTAFWLITLACLNAPLGCAQSFVASVKPTIWRPRVRLQLLIPTGFSASNVTLEMLIEEAYGIQEFQISDGPSWIRSDRFDVQAKATPYSDSKSDVGLQGFDKTRRRRMMQTLLVDRFGLKVHPETREEPVYALVIFGNAHKLQEVTSSGESATQPALSGRHAPGIRVGMGHLWPRG